jgi:hypothetical protein
MFMAWNPVDAKSARRISITSLMIDSPFGGCISNMWQCEPLAHFHFFIASVEKHVLGSFEKARLRFAHAETVLWGKN